MLPWLGNGSTLTDCGRAAVRILDAARQMAGRNACTGGEFPSHQSHDDFICVKQTGKQCVYRGEFFDG